ncbi:MAG: hypothetical protein WBE39_14675 [Candidatus Competibacter sp.]
MIDLVQIAEQNPTLIFKPSMGGQLLSRILANAYLQANIKALATEQQITDHGLRQTSDAPSRQGATDPFYGSHDRLGFPTLHGLRIQVGQASHPGADSAERQQIKPGLYTQQPKRRAAIKPLFLT